jgi:hypothetical protein
MVGICFDVSVSFILGLFPFSEPGLGVPPSFSGKAAFREDACEYEA